LLQYIEGFSGTRVTPTVFDIEGRRIVTLLDAIQFSGMHRVIWKGRGQRDTPVSSGVYFYRLRVGRTTLIRKMVLTK